MINFNPFPIIKTKNLILRRMDYKDINDLFEMRRDPRMNDYTDIKLDETIRDTEDYVYKMNKGIDDNIWVIWAIEHKQSCKVIGSISIWNINMEEENAELGYGIIPDFQGQGLMKESLQAVVNYGFNIMDLREILAYTEENNIKSIRLLENCDFVEINRVWEKGYFSNRIYNMIVYRLQNQK